MPLFYVQDDDRPMYVNSESFGTALESWKKFIATENGCSPDGVELPLGIKFIAPSDEVIWDVE